MANASSRDRARILRRRRVRRTVRGTNERPRLCVYRSQKHIYAQIISDESGQALAAASTQSAELQIAAQPKTGTVSAARQVGALIARKCQAKGITAVIFDRNGFLYHGRVRAVAEAARDAGLNF